MPDTPNASATSIATPPGPPKGFARLLTWRTLPLLGARIAIRLARSRGKPIRLGKVVLAVRHRHVSEVLSRDLDYLVEPVYGPRFDEIGYRFVLGMDRSALLAHERRVLYKALAAVDMTPIEARAAAAVAQALAGKTEIDVVEDYARPVAAGTAQALFGIAPEDQAAFSDAARAIFYHGFLNVTGDAAITARGKAAAKLLDGWFDSEIARRRAEGRSGGDMMGRLIAHHVDDDLIRRSLGGMLVGSIDTTATAVAKVVSEMIRDPRLLASARRDTRDLLRLWGWCQEALRRWPQTPLVTRAVRAATDIEGMPVPAGAKVVLWTQAAMFDASAFPTPQALRATRPEAPYLHLGGGLHPCAGRALNAWQIPLLVGALLDRMTDGGPGKLGKMAWAGPFPAHLPLTFGGRRP